MAMHAADGDVWELRASMRMLSSSTTYVTLISGATREHLRAQSKAPEQRIYFV